MKSHSTPRLLTSRKDNSTALARWVLALAVLAATGCASGRSLAPTPAILASVLTDSVRAVLEASLADSAFPGAIAIVGGAAGIHAVHAVGRIDWPSESPPVTDTTIWDLASLTKVVGTTTAIMQLWSDGRLALDAPVSLYLPRFTGSGRDVVTVRHLLTHSSGLPAFKRFFEYVVAPEEVLDSIYHMPLDTLPGTRMVYSDLGAILLGKIVERVSGRPLDDYLREHVFEPLAMTDTRFRPPAWTWSRIAPTEQDPWRGRLVRGEVHDENAHLLGGVSGHAGLFGSARDLARFARMLLAGGELDGQRVLARTAISRFTRVQDRALSHRALGWETPNGINSAGHRLSRRAFGHTGFTGTSLWIDPSHDLFVLLLSNRVNPTRANQKILQVRVRLADAVLGAYDAARRIRPHSNAGHP